jgi:hypothetical protein
MKASGRVGHPKAFFGTKARPPARHGWKSREEKSKSPHANPAYGAPAPGKEKSVASEE